MDTLLPFRKLTAFFLFLLLAVLGLSLNACSSGTTSPTLAALAPTAALTNAQAITPTLTPTSAPAVAATTAAAVSLTGAPSAIPTLGGMPTGVASNALSAAAARSASAPSIRMHMSMVGDAAQMSAFLGIPTNAAAATTVDDSEFSGKDYHSVTTGMPAQLLTDGDRLETASFGGKSLIHGPIAAMQAPENKWYQLPPSTSISTGTPAETIAHLGAATSDWSGFTRSAPGQSMDGQSCDLYKGDKVTASKVMRALLNDNSAPGEPTIDDGAITAAVCSDGYLHDVSMTLAVHLNSQKGEVKYKVHLSDFGKITLSPPTDVTVLSDSTDSTPIPTETGNAELTPTEDAGMTIGDAESLVRRFFDEVNANYVDAAMELLDSSAILTVARKPYMSEDDIRGYLSGQVSKGVKYSITDVTAHESLVTFTLAYGTSKGTATAITDGQVISVLTLP